MTDAADFERIATAVLRAAKPALYEKMSHPGVQPGGKTIKAPLDNLAWVRSDDGARFVCAAHTTEKNDLKGKWLHDPMTVSPRKTGGKPTKPQGDLVKGISEIQKLRKNEPALTATLALTTNQEPSLELSEAAELLALHAKIELDVWSVSRIAHFLDTDATGQIIRRNYLGSPIKLLSKELLLEMGKRSIQDHLPHAMTNENIRRDDFVLERRDALVAGASGMGKTTACAVALAAHIDKGSSAVVLKVEFLSAVATIDEAIEAELRRQEPELEAGAGVKALSLCTGEDPLLILVEDVNRTDNPGLMLNKILSWMRISGKESQRRWRVVCPIWPRYLDVIEDQKRVLENVTVLRIDKYTETEAIRALCKRADVLRLQMDEHRAMSIAVRLGLDPLLIGLYDLTSDASGVDVIQCYIDERLGIVASQAERTRSEVVQALHNLLRKMLQHRIVGPRWTEVKSWISDQDTLELIRKIVGEGSVLSIWGSPETLTFRHDRVMYSLFSAAIADVLNIEPVPDYVIDPFFAEVVARAAVQVELPGERLLQLMDETPTTAAHALKLASEIGSSYINIADQVLRQWLQQEHVRGRVWANRRYEVARVFSEITTSYVRPLIAQFPIDDRRWDPLLAASFRNGDVGAGLTLLAMYEIGTTVAGKQSLLALVKRLYGRNLISAVDGILRRGDLDLPAHTMSRVGALRLAGYLGDSSLAEAVRICWRQDNVYDKDLRSYLFAAARCCGADPDVTLGPICDAWEVLPEDTDSTMGQPAERLAADHVAWEFRDYVPCDAISYFVARANASKKLEWPITYMLRTIDHPDAIEQVARYAANSHFISVRFLQNDWERRSREGGRRMSSKSKQRLLDIANDKDEPDNVRRKAFSFWGVILDDGDLEIARQVSEGSTLHEQALWIRARLQDRSVIPIVLKKIPEDPEYWLRIQRYIWSDSLTETLPSLLDRVAAEHGERTNLEYIVAEAVGSAEPKRATAMLSDRWAKLKTKPMMVQAALLLSDPEASALVREAFTTTQTPSLLLEHFVMNCTIESNGKYRLSSLAQLQNLKPYLDYFPEEEIQSLKRACIRRGWNNFSNQYLEPRLRSASQEEAFATDQLDGALNRKPNEFVNLYSWLEQLVNRGITRDKAMDVLLHWLKQHEGDRTIAIVGDIVAREANRQEYMLFESVAGQSYSSSAVVKAIRFDVFSRSLV